MRILVIGGTYFLGKAFVYQACGAHDITILNRGTQPLPFPIKSKAGETADHDQPANWQSATQAGIKTIITDRHALTSGCLGDRDFDVVVDFCAYEKGDIEQVLDALSGRVKQYIFISTTDVYARGTGKPLDEKGPLETRDFGGEAGAYIRGKAALEQELVSCREKYGVHTTSVRPAFLYGPSNYAPREGIFFHWIDQAGQVLCPSDTQGSFHMVFVKDAARILCTLCGNPKAYDIALNLCGPEKVTYESFCNALAYATDKPFEKIYVSSEEIQKQQIPLPFPVTANESETYVSLYEDLFNISYLPLNEGMKITYASIHENDDHSLSDAHGATDAPDPSDAHGATDVLDLPGASDLFDTIDALFDANKPKEALAFMSSELQKAKDAGNNDLTLRILNELIGYYRQTSEAEPLLHVIDESLSLIDRMQLQGTVPYATTALNVANAYRSIGMTKESRKYYEMTEHVYQACIENGTLSENDMLLAGLYNNISLLYQELTDYETAKQYLLKALDIVRANNAGFEIAVTYANLANTSVLAGLRCSIYFDEAEAYAKTAIQLFKARGLRDPHYCAALSALGTCYYEKGKWRQARFIFADAMKIVEETFGKNNQYNRLKGNCEMCDKMLKDTPKNGLELAKSYYETYGKPMIHDKFPDYESKIAVGLCGEGSDCFGYDDALSEDHDFGPDFCMWLDDETYDAIGEALQQAYEDLPKTFAGYTRTTTATGKGRRGVMRISDYYKKFVGTDQYDQIDFRSVPDYALAACVNGEVFRDDRYTNISFSIMRNRLKQGYPADIRLLKLAEDAAGFSQCGQYNYERFHKRDDAFTAALMLSDCMKHAMKLYHHLLNVYPPHDKWLYKSTSLLPGGTEITKLLDQIMYTSLGGGNSQSIIDMIEDLGSLFAMKLYEASDISDIDPYLDHHTEELLFKSGIATLSIEELAEKIARLEFEAFDKVQNEGGRASCQNNWPIFSVMRKSQYLTWNREMLMQYLYDFDREYRLGHNLITEKYGRMMESTAPERYEEIKENFPELSETKKAVIEQIVGIQMGMADALSEVHPKVISQARSLHTYEDNPEDTSYETYLRGEISTYSDKMLQLYGSFVVQAAQSGVNLAQITMENTAKLYGYKSLDEFEAVEGGD